jgi:hypothetical protein
MAECEMIRDSATDPEKRQLFSKMADHFRVLAVELENAINGREGFWDTFLGRKTQEPFPKEED